MPSIENHVPDGTFVDAVAKLVHPAPSLQKLGRGRHVILVGENHHLIGEPPLAEPHTLTLSTLTGIVDAYEARTKLKTATESPVVQVVSPTKVLLLDPSVGEERQAFYYAESTAIIPEFRWGYYYEIEDFIPAILTRFADDGDRSRLQEYVGNLRTGLTAEIQDDGATQTVSTRKGITRTGETQLQNPLALSPYRTFPEIIQPLSPFVFRVQQVQRGESLVAQAALFEADGGKWRQEAITHIGEWLRSSLPEDAVVLS